VIIPYLNIAHTIKALHETLRATYLSLIGKNC